MGSFQGEKVNVRFTLVEGDSDVLELSPAERARLLRKLDWHLLPLVSLLYLLCFL